MLRLTRSISYVPSAAKMLCAKQQKILSLKVNNGFFARNLSATSVYNGIFFKKGSEEISPEILDKINKRPDPPSEEELIRNERIKNADIGFKAAPAPFKAIVKIMLFGVTILIIIKYFINDKKNIKYSSDSKLDGPTSEEYVNMATMKPGLPIGPSDAVRKSEYEGSGNSYVSRKAGDKLTKW